MTTAVAAPAIQGEAIECAICGGKVHSIKHHLKNDHPGVSVEDYQAKYPGQPLLSAFALARVREHEAAQRKKAEAAATVEFKTEVGTFHDVFGLPANKVTLSAEGKPIPIRVMPDSLAEGGGLVPDLDPNYVFNVDVLKAMVLGLEMDIPIYLWGHAGTGKTTIIEQICHRTKRPLFRVQHTANMEEEHVVGGWRLRDGKTVFELGPLPMAMKNGWTYLADEFDFGRPEVLSLYQAVLEGKPLVIKEADEANRIIRPHPAFRMVATGNTNGQGDDTGMYQGTNLQNAASYERFGIVEKMPYMAPALETSLVARQAKIPEEHAKKLVEFATRVREEFDGGKLGNPISPRSLIYAGKLGKVKGNYKTGLEWAFMNRLSAVDRQAVDSLAQRVFG